MVIPNMVTKVQNVDIFNRICNLLTCCLPSPATRKALTIDFLSLCINRAYNGEQYIILVSLNHNEQNVWFAVFVCKLSSNAKLQYPAVMTILYNAERRHTPNVAIILYNVL